MALQLTNRCHLLDPEVLPHVLGGTETTNPGNVINQGQQTSTKSSNIIPWDDLNLINPHLPPVPGMIIGCTH
jgi:hypothetical protein